ncbi:hypothetical protein Dimus_013617, partial [Dionaea muscipula]
LRTAKDLDSVKLSCEGAAVREEHKGQLKQACAKDRQQLEATLLRRSREGDSSRRITSKELHTKG